MTTAKKAKRSTLDFLGGFDALDEAATKVSANTPFAPRSDFMPDPEQPRKDFDEESLRRLGKGMKAGGVLQALLVRDNTSGVGPRFIIIDGERRWRSAEIEDIAELPYMVRNDIDPKRLRFAQAMANANREDLRDYELAVVIKEILDDNPGMKQADIAEQLGKDRGTVSRLLALLDPEYVELAQKGLIESASALSHFKSLDEEKRVELLTAAKEQGATITREAVEVARKSQKIEVPEHPAANDVPNALSPGESEKGTADGADDAASGSQNLDNADPGQLGGAGEDSDSHGLNDDAHGPNGGEPGGEVATPRAKSGESSAKAAASVKLTLNIETLERLIPFFVDKEQTKVELKISQDEAVGLIENLGKTVPDNINEFAGVIKAAME